MEKPIGILRGAGAEEVQCDRKQSSQASFLIVVLSPRPGYTTAEQKLPLSLLKLVSMAARLWGPQMVP